jgi:hypothetical protein
LWKTFLTTSNSVYVRLGTQYAALATDGFSWAAVAFLRVLRLRQKQILLLRTAATPAPTRRPGAPDKGRHLARLPRTGSKPPKLSAFVIQPQLVDVPTPFPSPKRHPATIPPVDLASKSHRNHRSTPIRQIDVMRPRTPNLRSAPSPCVLAAARLAM